jgi:hypothetical protein
MTLTHGKGVGHGVYINLTGEEVAMAIHSWLVAHGVYISGPRTIRVNEELCREGYVYVDPSGSVVHNGRRFCGGGNMEAVT